MKKFLIGILLVLCVLSVVHIATSINLGNGITPTIDIDNSNSDDEDDNDLPNDDEDDEDDNDLPNDDEDEEDNDETDSDTDEEDDSDIDEEDNDENTEIEDDSDDSNDEDDIIELNPNRNTSSTTDDGDEEDNDENTEIEEGNDELQLSEKDNKIFVVKGNMEIESRIKVFVEKEDGGDTYLKAYLSDENEALLEVFPDEAYEIANDENISCENCKIQIVELKDKEGSRAVYQFNIENDNGFLRFFGINDKFNVDVENGEILK